MPEAVSGNHKLLPEDAPRPTKVAVTMTRSRRGLLLAIGWFFVALGTLGAFLPVLPTTPFMLLALWAFSQSSQRFHDWLYTHPLLGPPLQKWHRYGVISRRAKIMALATMSASLLIMILFTPAPDGALIAAGGLMAVGAGYVLSRPSRPPAM